MQRMRETTGIHSQNRKTVEFDVSQMNVAFQTVKAIRAGGFIDYEAGWEAWCGHCGRKRSKRESKPDKNGRVVCMKCGRPLRANTHNKTVGE